MEVDENKKACVFDIRKYAVNDGPGIRTTVFLKGCPLRCIWCHNPEGLKPNPEKIFDAKKNKFVQVGDYKSIEDIMPILLQDKIFYSESSGGVTISGGEPLMQFDFLLELCKKLHFEGIHVCVDTSGFVEQNKIAALIPFVNCWLYDIKIMDETLHQQFTGVSNKFILENFLFLQQNNANVIIRIPLIPDITATESNLNSIIAFLIEHQINYPIHLLPLHKMAKEKYAKMQLSNPYQKMDTLDETIIRQWIQVFDKNNFNPIIIQ